MNPAKVLPRPPLPPPFHKYARGVGASKLPFEPAALVTSSNWWQRSSASASEEGSPAVIAADRGRRRPERAIDEGARRDEVYAHAPVVVHGNLVSLSQ
jgi:hypothetical protein